MSGESESDERQAPEAKQPWWTRVFRLVFPGTTTGRWDRLPEGSQQDVAGRNIRGGM